ncbi:MAG: pseudouridine synthase [Cytophagales bacterium]|nr:pseudouridine synthase [Cytophagales bacterium]
MATLAPTRAGVSASMVYLPPEQSTSCGTMFEFFTHTFSKINPNIWQERFDQGLVVDQDGRAVSPSAAYVGRQHLFYYRHVESEPRIPFDAVVLYQDEHLVVADKPHFLPVTPSGRYVQETLLVRLKNQLGLPNLSPLHRLDRDTAGLVLLGVQPKERGAYQQMFHDRQVHKTYEAIAPYREDLTFPMTYESRLEDSPIYMQMHEVAGKPNSRTHIALQGILPARPSGERASERLALYELKPVTGKRHQLRVHMNALGLPILNDGIYPTLTPEQLVMTEADYAKPLQLLAKGLSFVDPITKLERVFESGRRFQLDFPV